ncbi:hypothetical protein GcM3_017022 [Golovinomyces cichoracearum]|uniref:Uncharacterized protein n=1 Tax=Golovinomyces cichoracearum TaxID=62708 RepID=A0A420J8E7_9PEZI|nr:hypothetical protein GcM3_017022 [Golovinomyces cichoracearum]
MNEKPDSDQKKVADKQRDWAAGINLLTDTDEYVKEFIKNRIQVYKSEEHKGDDLWWDFYDYFKEFTDPESFLRTGTELPRRLRDTLRARGVYPPKDKKLIASNLDECQQVKFSRNMEVQGMIGTRNRQPKPKIGGSPSELLELPDSDDTTYDAARIANYTLCGYSRQLGMLAKIYDDQSEYSGNGDTFDYKFDIFLRLCENADIPESSLEIAFPIMLKEDARDFFFSFYDKREEKCLEELCNDIKNNFEGVEYKRTLLSECNRLTFKLILDDEKNFGKGISDCLQNFTQKLRIMQHGLDKNLRNDAFIHNKSFTACESQEAFRNVCERPCNTLSGLRSELRSAADYHDRRKLSASFDQTLFIDKRYHQNKLINCPQIGPDFTQGRAKPFVKENHGEKIRCVVCNKDGCWSSNHSIAERDEAFDRIKRSTSERINKIFSQDIIQIEGQPPNDKVTDGDEYSDLEEEMETFILDTAFLAITSRNESSTFTIKSFNSPMNELKYQKCPY